jgi:sugar lactone lactonase YvrE
LAGSGTGGYIVAATTSAQFNNPIALAVDASGNVYVADYSNNRIRKITSGGMVSTIAGSGATGHSDAAGTLATFYTPTGIAVDGTGNVYVADAVNSSIRKIVPGTNMVSTYAGVNLSSGGTNGPRTSATFNQPLGIAVDATGNVYVADAGNNLIRRIDVNTGVVSTVAGSGTFGSQNGPVANASFQHPISVAVNADGSIVYVVEASPGLIRKIDVAAATVSTLAGAGYASADPQANCKGVGTAATFSSPQSVTLDTAGNVFVVSIGDNSVCKITAGGAVTKIAGTGVNGSNNGAGSQATFNLPHGVAVDTTGNLYVADYANHLIRKISF